MIALLISAIIFQSDSSVNIWDSDAYCLDKSEIILCRNHDVFNDMEAGVYEIASGKSRLLGSLKCNVTQIVKYKNGFIVGCRDGRLALADEKFFDVQFFDCPDKTSVNSIVEISPGLFLFLFGSGKIYKYSADNNIFSMYLPVPGEKFSRILYSKKHGLIHLVNRFSVISYDYRTSEKKYIIYCHLAIGTFSYSKNEDRFMLSWFGVNLLDEPRLIHDGKAYNLFFVYDMKNGNIARMNRVSAAGELLALQPVSDSEAAFISSNKGEINYGVFRDGGEWDLHAVNVIGTVAERKDVTVLNPARIIAVKGKKAIYQIYGKYY